MATKPKKTPTKKKSPARKRTRKKPKKSSNSKRNILLVSAPFLIILLIAIGYFLGQESNSSAKPKAVQNDTHTKVKSVPEKMKEKKTVTKKTVIKDVKQIEKAVEKPKVKKDKQFNDKNIALAYRTKRAKLVIIIDDVHTQAQINAIKALNMKVTPSIFPPYKSAPDSHLLARGLKHYMIHLPMESNNDKFNRQYKTLKTSFSKKSIQTRVKEIRALFPEATYINNHTGSVFTANYEAMAALYVALRKEGFVFIDSRTTGLSQVRKIAHGFGDAYVARDTFIDNVHSVPAIHKQLIHAVKLAKKNGYAVAIGHPHSVTMEALASAKTIFKDIDLVYIDEIYR
jgi:polysaccharide deacetylase 2 family uncharacterized protein YibQ